MPICPVFTGHSRPQAGRPAGRPQAGRSAGHSWPQLVTHHQLSNIILPELAVWIASYMCL